jgi:hypothetical protein
MILFVKKEYKEDEELFLAKPAKTISSFLNHLSSKYLISSKLSLTA